MTARTQLNAAWRICYFNGLVPLGRQPLLTAAVFLTPFSFLFFLYVIAKPEFFPYGVVGGVLFTSLFTGNGMLNDCAYLRLERQLQPIFVASPVRPIAYLLGMALSELAFTIPALGLFLGILQLVHPLSAFSFLALLGVALVTWLMSTTLGFLISTFFRQLREIWPIGTLTFSTLSVLPPVFYPLSIIHAPYRWIAFLAPSTYSAVLADRAVGLSGAPDIAPGFLSDPFVELGVLVAITLLFALAAVYLARWREP
ncbi:MAG: ABC transporter permease [Thermoplasmata archaeon]|nr:ABC transporter permease [Thermoplasmata archaeon]